MFIQNEKLRYVCETLCPRRQQSPKSYFSFKVKVNVTMLLTLVLFERASFIEYACKICVRIPKIKEKANYNKITLSTIKQLSTILNEKKNHLV